MNVTTKNFENANSCISFNAMSYDSLFHAFCHFCVIRLDKLPQYMYHIFCFTVIGFMVLAGGHEKLCNLTIFALLVNYR